MKVADQAYFEALLTLTAQPEWEMLVQEVEKMIYQEQADGFELAKDWGEVKERRGYAKGLAFVVNLRDTVKKQIAAFEESEDASV